MLIYYGDIMALLKKEQAALVKLESAMVHYYNKVLGLELYLDSSRSVEERLLALAVELQTAA